jgi:hypothetical protein
MYKFYGSLLGLLFLLGCSCKHPDTIEPTVVDNHDQLKSCSQIVYSIQESEYLLKFNRRRTIVPHLFANYFICTPYEKMDAIKHKHILRDRIEYLKTLYELKDCRKQQQKKEKEVQKQEAAKKKSKSKIIDMTKIMTTKSK